MIDISLTLGGEEVIFILLMIGVYKVGMYTLKN